MTICVFCPVLQYCFEDEIFGGLLESSWKCLNFFSNSAEGKAEEVLSENEVEEQEMQEILAKANEEELKQLKR